jgi:ribonuclease HI
MINYEENPIEIQKILNRNKTFYSDGSSNKIKDTTKFIGGHAFILVDKGIEVFNHANHSLDTTNNRQELLGFLNSLLYALKVCNKETVYFCSDSQYVIKGSSEYLNKWKKNNWKTFDKKDVKNKDLWVKVDNAITLLKKNNIVEPLFCWIRGHNDHVFNERVDFLCTEETKKAKLILINENNDG